MIASHLVCDGGPVLSARLILPAFPPTFPLCQCCPWGMTFLGMAPYLTAFTNCPVSLRFFHMFGDQWTGFPSLKTSTDFFFSPLCGGPFLLVSAKVLSLPSSFSWLCWSTFFKESMLHIFPEAKKQRAHFLFELGEEKGEKKIGRNKIQISKTCLP